MVNPRQELPAWYRRLHALTTKEDRDVTPEDFDEDLSSVSGLSIDSEADVSKHWSHGLVLGKIHIVNIKCLCDFCAAL
ncbi:hypothetical protein I7I53_03782 [Histoplasma capsulatum var. duboisii H88]|uniref:Uncharacterized protein n=1 Tax=Ajellomyces capsulatus (strain H88) TaxID=544711 RepID=A0A8A1LR24_AJEC8|nr:hypothetical protein I7I53_03782 [Histoplasma capsulatum var. duboisii H88]